MHDGKYIIVCADDFAQDRSICAGILSLVEAGRLSAVSCFTDSPLWPKLGRALVRARPDLLIGLHFNLTFAFGFQVRPLHHWLLRSIAGRVDRSEVYSALVRQLDRFASETGRLPDFIDGHEHVHVFPGVREVVNEAAAERSDASIRLRDVTRPIGETDARLKRDVIRAMARLGGRPPGWRPLNTGFGGDYSLSVRAPFGALFASWLNQGPPGSLIMCHPRFCRDGVATTARDAEFDFLASSRFLDALARSRTRLVRTQWELPDSTTVGAGFAHAGAAQKRPSDDEGYFRECPSNPQSSASSLLGSSPRRGAGRARASNR